ncbi:MAG: ABC transporter permease [Muribaculaceae bacterium]|nr:ABC transporter permease [Muribaculaceae bacterium]
MKPGVSPVIAWRYLTGRKTHSAVNAIAAVAVAGVAVATAAMICVMAVFNGFHSLLTERLDRMTPDISLTPKTGKTIADGDSLAEALGSIPGVALATPVVADNALALYCGHETPVRLRGVRVADYRRMTALDSILIGDSAPLEEVDRTAEVDPDTYEVTAPPANASASIGAASRAGIDRLGATITIFAPKRIGRVNMANPLNSFVVDSLTVTSIYEAQQNDFDENSIITDIETVRGLFLYDTEATSVDVMALPGTDVSRLAGSIREATGGKWHVRDRAEQHTLSFRMVNVEKWMSFLLLAFILVIASFNIISTLSMMVVEKEDSMRTLRALGMSRRGVGGVFAWESLFVTLAGGLGGIILGCVLCLAQQKWGLIHLAGNPDELVVKAYPVALQWSDIGAAFLPLVAIGVVCALISAAFARSRLGDD